MKGFYIVMTSLALCACAQVPLITPPAPTDYERTLYHARQNVDAGNYWAAERLLNEFLRGRDGGREDGGGTAYYRALALGAEDRAIAASASLVERLPGPQTTRNTSPSPTGGEGLARPTARQSSPTRRGRARARSSPSKATSDSRSSSRRVSRWKRRSRRTC